VANKTTPIEYDVIDVIIVLISIVITELISCLTSQNSKLSTQNLGSNDLQSNSTMASKSGKTKNPLPSQSNRLSKDTAARKKVAGGSKKASPKRPTGSSTRNRRSKPLSKSANSTKSGSSQAFFKLGEEALALDCQLQTATGKSVLLPVQQNTILKNDHTTADEHDTRKAGASTQVGTS